MILKGEYLVYEQRWVDIITSTQNNRSMVFNYMRSIREFSLIFLTRTLRMFSYGLLVVIFFQNLFYKGLTEMQSSFMQTCIIAGDICITLYLTTKANCIGRINTLMIASLLKLITGIVYSESEDMTILTITGLLGVISVTGGEIGPFMSIEKTVLVQLVEKCTEEHGMIENNVKNVLGLYKIIGFLAQALGSVFAGYYIKGITEDCGSEFQGISNLMKINAGIGGVLFLLYFCLNRDSVESDHPEEKTIFNCSGIEKKNIKSILVLSFLFAADGVAGAFIVQSFLSFYYAEKYDRTFDQIGIYLFICTIVTGISGIMSSKIVHCIGPVATLIFIHIPSNVFLLLMAFTENIDVSLYLLFAHFCTSQMDVPVRQALVTIVASPSEPASPKRLTKLARSVGLALGLVFNGLFMRMNPDILGFSVPFLIAGGVKILYDLSLGVMFFCAQKQDKSKGMEVNSIQITDSSEANIEGRD